MKNLKSFEPPKVAARLLRWFCDPDLIEDVEGDLVELFSRRSSKGVFVAKCRFFLEVLLLFRPGIIKNFELRTNLIKTAMIRNYLRIALRNVLRYKGFTALNLLGLIVGIVSSMLILLWVNNEVLVDKFHQNGDKVYQLFRNMKQSSGVINTTWSIPKPAADLLIEEYSEVDQVAQLSWPMDLKFTDGEKQSKESGFYASANFLSVFSFEVLAGDKKSALSDLASIAISRTVAEKQFGSTWKEVAIGSSLQVEEGREVIVKAVFEDIGMNSSLQFDWLLPAAYFFKQNRWVDDWGNGSFRIFFTLTADSNLSEVEKRVYNEIISHSSGQENAGEEYLIVQKFQENYLYSNFENGEVNGGRIDYVKIMTIVAIFIMLVACINFMNLATARSGRRSKEIGLRKVMGSYRSAISLQFFIESTLFSAIATVLSVLMVLLLLPSFSLLVNRDLFIDFTAPTTWYFLSGVILGVGFFSGLYPAILLPSFDIIKSLKGSVKQSSGAAYFRKGLVVFQFAISTLLLVGTAVIYNQLEFVLDKNLGLVKENLVAIQMDEEFGGRLATYRSEMNKIPEVMSVSAASGNPISYGRSTSSVKWDGMGAGGYEINILITDNSFIETMGMEMELGRDFSKQLKDSTSVIINQVLADMMGFEDPVNQDLSFWGINGKVVGVVKNFHMQNLHEPIAPLLISCIAPERTNMALVRLQGDRNTALKSIKALTAEIGMDENYDYEFVDQVYADSYESEMIVSVLVKIFAFISVFISCLGLFGLSAFSAEQRSKEVGVRKVHGASVSELVLLLSKDYSILMIISFILSAPVAYYFGNQWLQGFEFRTTLHPLIFLLAGFGTFLIGGMTVAIKSFQAAKVNPIRTLKDE